MAGRPLSSWAVRMRTDDAALCADDQFLRSAASMLRAYLPDLMDAMRLSNLYRLLFMEDRLLVTAASITVDRESQSRFFFQFLNKVVHFLPVPG